MRYIATFEVLIGIWRCMTRWCSTTLRPTCPGHTTLKYGICGPTTLLTITHTVGTGLSLGPVLVPGPGLHLATYGRSWKTVPMRTEMSGNAHKVPQSRTDAWKTSATMTGVRRLQLGILQCTRPPLPSLAVLAAIYRICAPPMNCKRKGSPTTHVERGKCEGPIGRYAQLRIHPRQLYTSTVPLTNLSYQASPI